MIFIDYILIFPNWMLLQTKENSIVLFPTLCFSYFIVKINKNKGNIGLKNSNQTMIKHTQENDVLHREIYMEIRKKDLIIRKALV